MWTCQDLGFLLTTTFPPLVHGTAAFSSFKPRRKNTAVKPPKWELSNVSATWDNRQVRVNSSAHGSGPRPALLSWAPCAALASPSSSQIPRFHSLSPVSFSPFLCGQKRRCLNDAASWAFAATVCVSGSAERPPPQRHGPGCDGALGPGTRQHFACLLT